MDGEEGILVPISALEHFSYCPRQCALIHVEQTFDENVFTIRGHLAHERSDAGERSMQDGIRQLRALPLHSEQYGLVGKADVVEVHPAGPVPVEHKVGPISGSPAEIQLCAQALCLEEMFNTTVRWGQLYSNSTKRRRRVPIDDDLREGTRQAILAVRTQLTQQQVPAPVNDSRCRNCSLINACLPEVAGARAKVRGHQGSLFRPANDESVEGWFDV